jgi:hypothetical protein
MVQKTGTPALTCGLALVNASVLPGEGVSLPPRASVTETASPNAAVELRATFGPGSKNAIGANARLTIDCHLTSHIGVGPLVRCAAPTPRLPNSDGTTDTVRADGPQTGLGLRYRF